MTLIAPHTTEKVIFYTLLILDGNVVCVKEVILDLDRPNL